MLCPNCGAPTRSVRGRCPVCGRRLTADMLPPGRALVVRAGTPLRDRPGSPAAVLQTLSRGEVVELLGREGGFVHVRLETGVAGYVDAINVREPQRAEPVAAPAPVTEPLPDVDLPYGLDYLPGERLLYYGHFLYDPFGDRVFVLTTHRVILGGGGTALPRVYQIREIGSVGMREGSSGMALGERTIVLTVATAPGEIYIAGLRDPDRALACLRQVMREAE